MNKLQLREKRKETYRKFRIQQSTQKRPVNAVYLSPANSLKHELKKTEICWSLLKEGKKFITEAFEIETNKRRDIVCLDNGEIVEVERNKKRAERHKNAKVVLI